MQANKEQKIVIDIWTDFMCPLCYIQKTNLDAALQQFEHSEAFEIVYHPFQLYPDAPSNTGKNYYEYTSITHGGMPIEKVIEGNKPVLELAKSVGLNYNYEILIPTNTGKALQVSMYAQEKGKAKEWISRVYKAYFIDGLDIGDTKTLVLLAKEVALSPEEVAALLEDRKYKGKVYNERLYGQEKGIRGVPFISINEKYVIHGVENVERLSQILNQVWIQKNPKLKMISTGATCDVNGNCI